MAIFFADVKVFSRSKGESAVAAAAYRSGLRLVDERTGVTHDYRRRHGVVDFEVFAPPGAPAWARDPGRLFVEAELTESRVNSRTARELQVALPFELDGDQRARLVADLADLLVERYGVAVLAATHEPSGKGDERNFHTHLLFTTRAVTPSGFGAKVRCLDDKRTGPEEVEALRALVAERTNAALKAAGAGARVDHRRLTVQAAEAEAKGDIARAVMLTRAVIRTEGKAGTASKRRGGHTPRTLWNDVVRHDNRAVLTRFLAGAKVSRRQPVHAPRISSAPSPGFGPARGPGTRVLNVQAERSRRQRQADEAGVQRWLAMLERERIRIAADARKTLAAYAVAARLTRADMRALVAHGKKDARCFEHLGRVLSARTRAHEASEKTDRARDKHAAAMVKTAVEAAKVERLETVQAPPVWRPMNRRAWADHRRRQRAALAAAQAAERTSLEAARDSGPEKAVADWERLERERRNLFPCPSDEAAATEMPPRAPRKIGNKIGADPAGEPPIRSRPAPQPAMRRRRPGFS